MSTILFSIPELCIGIVEALPKQGKDFWRRYDLIDETVPIEDRETRAALASLARVSKTFHEPATDALWRDLESLSPFACLVPKDLLESKRELSKAEAVRHLLISSTANISTDLRN